MSKAVKELVINDVKKTYGAMDNLMVVNVHRLTGNDVNALRRTLRKKNVEVHVIKNRFARLALAGTPLEPVAAALSGPCAFVSGGASPVDTAKTLMDLVKEYPALELRSGILDGETSPLTIEQISKRRSKAEIQGEVVMLLTSPGRRLAGCLNVGGRVAGCIKAIADKLEKGEAITKVA